MFPASNSTVSTITQSSRFIPSTNKDNNWGSCNYTSTSLNSKNLSNKEKIAEPRHFFDAVFIPVFTNIVGTLLYLRMGYVAGQAGICKFF